MALCCSRFLRLHAFLLIVAAAALAWPAVATHAQSTTLAIDGLGKGTAPLGGLWQFHLGDDPAWAAPGFDDSRWEQLTADKPWGLQGHGSYDGYAWYRRHIAVTPAPGAADDFTLLIPAIDDVYEIYWNGKLAGHLGTMPPHLLWLSAVPAQIYNLGSMHSGVLAIRVWKTPPPSNDPGILGGFEGLPQLGSAKAIAAAKGSMDFEWLRRQQFTFGLTSLYLLVALLSLIGWLRDRQQWLLFWMTIFAFTPMVELILGGLRLSYSTVTLICLTQIEINVRESSQLFLLLWLLQLHGNRKLVLWIRAMAVISIAAGTLDGILFYFYPAFLNAIQFEIWDAVFTFFILPVEVVPAILVAIAVAQRKRLDSARWMVAIFAFLNATIYWIENLSAQGMRFTHWTLAEKMSAPLFSFAGNSIGILLLFRTLLFISIIYAVVRYSIAERRRQTSLEQEIQNARELQQVLVPETLPALPGFTLTSAYRPAQEVGGDFFQIIPLDGPGGSTLVVLGDVSGKGLKAAMAVSMIVGSIRALAEATSNPAEILAGLNRRLYGRLQGGFATCVALRLDRDGGCAIATAGHPSPFLNGREISLPGALPLGVATATAYEESTFNLQAKDHFVLYTDGLLEARKPSGELFGFGRLEKLFATRPDADAATDAAVAFGQDDDITVLTFSRLEVGAPPEVAQMAACL